MARLMVIADDLTGANDTGVQFAKKGIPTVVFAGLGTSLPPDAEVVVVNTESRHIPPGDAADRVFRAATAGRQAGISHFFKKTDSTLRGNIGAELKALLHATGETVIPFVPAFPALGRTTRAGIHYVEGVPIAETAFGRDPLSPVRHSAIAAVLRANADLPVSQAGLHDPLPESGCAIFDCDSTEELRAISQSLGRRRLLAGSAALAEELPDLLELRRAKIIPVRPDFPILLVNGSLNERALEQIARAPDRDFRKLRMPADLFAGDNPAGFVQQALEVCEVERAGHSRVEFNPGRKVACANLLLYSVAHRSEYQPRAGEPSTHLHRRVADVTGQIVQQLLPSFGTLVVFGGDTLMGIARAGGWTAFTPRTEAGPGLTVANPLDRRLTLISKAGGFGGADVVREIVRWVQNSSKAAAHL